MNWQNAGNGPHYFDRQHIDDKYFTLANLKYYFWDYRGRISRSEFWLGFVLLSVAGLFLNYLIFSPLFNNSSLLAAPWGYRFYQQDLATSLVSFGFRWLIFGICLIVLNVFYCMLAIKRAHDRDRPGWFILFSWVPPIPVFWVFIELGFLRGTEGGNTFGNDPLLRFGAGAMSPGDDPYQRFERGFTPTGQYQAYPQGSGSRGAASNQQNQNGPVLKANSGEYAGARIPVDGNGIVIGRDPAACNLVISSKDVSRTHARITWNPADRKFMVEDLQSTNGVYVNRRRISGKAILALGESFTLAESGPSFSVECI